MIGNNKIFLLKTNLLIFQVKKDKNNRNNIKKQKIIIKNLNFLWKYFMIYFKTNAFINIKNFNIFLKNVIIHIHFNYF